MAVPVVASFAVQSISGLLSTFSSRNVARDRLARNQEISPDNITAHTEFVLQHHDTYKDLRRTSVPDENEESDEQRRKREIELVHSVVELAIRLEAQSRSMLVDIMDRDSLSRTVLMADRNGESIRPCR